MAEWTKKFNFDFEMKMSTLGENEENILTKNNPTMTKDDTKITFERSNKYNFFFTSNIPYSANDALFFPYFGEKTTLCSLKNFFTGFATNSFPRSA